MFQNKALGCVLFLLNFSLAQQIYPDVRRDETVVDKYHGVEVMDPYRWLEDLESDETKSFVESQTQFTADFLNKIPEREIIHEKLTALIDYPKFSAPIVKNGKYFYFQNTGLQGHDVFVVQDDFGSEPRVVFDPNEMSPEGAIAFAENHDFSSDAKNFAYCTTENGSDWFVGRFKNIETGTDYPETLNFVRWPQFQFDRDGAGVFYSRFPARMPEEAKNPYLAYHKLGTDQSEDIFITDISENPDWFLYAFVSACKNYLIISQEPDFKSNSLLIATLNGSAVTSKFLQVFSATEENAKLIYVTNFEDKFVFLTNKDAPNNRLVTMKINPASGTHEDFQTLVPERHKNILKSASAFHGDKLILTYLEDVKHKLYVKDLSAGEKEKSIDLPEGIVSGLSAYKENNEFFFKFENLVSPGTIYRCVYQKELECQVYRKIEGINTSGYTMKQVFFPSKDGEMIPMFIAHRKGLVLNGSAPTLLYGYGGFNADLLPFFSPFNFAFMEHFDGVYASANIRGGGEYGENWHAAAMLLKKQKSYDDFQGAAEYLIRERYTKPAKVVIQGASNGGLLVATCVNQRPDLFGVALPEVALTDMLRYQRFSIGFKWCSEYGCSENEEEFHNLYKFSPLHNIKFPSNDTQSYPAILVTTASNDQRLPPSHSFKYIAELQNTIGRNQKQANPLLLRVSVGSGHNSELAPISQIIDDYASSFAFIAKQFQKDPGNEISVALNARQNTQL